MVRRVLVLSAGLVLFFAALLSLAPRNASSAPVPNRPPLKPDPICM
jgi:hypothetical protein